MSNTYTQFVEELPVTGQQAVWLEHLWKEAVGVTTGTAEFVDLSIKLFGDRQAHLCALSVRTEPLEAQPVKIRLTCEDSCDLEETAMLLQAFLQRFELDTVITIPYAVVCDKMIAGAFGGGVVVVTAQRYVVWETNKLMELAEEEVRRAL